MGERPEFQAAGPQLPRRVSSLFIAVRYIEDPQQGIPWPKFCSTSPFYVGS